MGQVQSLRITEELIEEWDLACAAVVRSEQASEGERAEFHEARDWVLGTTAAMLARERRFREM